MGKMPFTGNQLQTGPEQDDLKSVSPLINI